MPLKDTALLPAGFRDLLVEEATLKADMTYSLGKIFQHYGYMRVSPPLVEFETSLFAGTGHTLEQQTFRLLDPLSHNMMGIRADITMQVARIAATRLSNEPKPLRLSYVGDVLHVKGKGLHAARQSTQAGIELIGSENNRADAEVILTSIDALEKQGLRKVSIDFTIPQLTSLIIDDANIPQENRKALDHALSKKDTDAIAAIAGKATETLVALTSLPPSGKEAMAALQSITLPTAAKELCQDLAEVIDLVRTAKPSLTITIDLIEFRGFKYHTGIAFSLFSTKDSEEVGAGGRYEITNQERTMPAVGCTLYINTLLRIIEPYEQAEKVYITPNEDRNEVAKLRDEQGYITIAALETEHDHKAIAESLGCDYIFQNGKLEDL